MQASTRRYNFAGKARFIPFMDFANHRPGCSHTTIRLEPCKAAPALKQWVQRLPAERLAKVLQTASSSQLGDMQSGVVPGGPDSAAGESRCVVWRAGEPVSAGQEVCYMYKPVMLQDMSLLLYGFLQVSQSHTELTEHLSLAVLAMLVQPWAQDSAASHMLLLVCFAQLLPCCWCLGNMRCGSRG